MRKIPFVLLLFLVVVVFSTTALARSPLTLPGKKSVYQRVISHPKAKLYAGAEEGARALRTLKTFTPLYIYAREGNRLEVGVGTRQADGWVNASNVTEWAQAITMLFTDRSGRDPVLFFKDHASLLATCQANSVAGEVRRYLEASRSGQQDPSNPVIATEPQDSAVSEKNFYLLPVLNIDAQFPGMKLVEVASLDPGVGDDTGDDTGEAGQGGGQRNAPSGPNANNAKELRIGFAFVIDTTISMGPYIRQTVDLVRTLYNELEKSPYANKMAFAVVAFRSSTKKTKGLEYTARKICDFTTVENRKQLEDALSKVQEAKVSTHDINEDSFAGILEAAESLSWDQFGSRVMLMISDAGPLKADDPTSSTKLTPLALKDFLKQKHIYLTCAHVTGKNKKNDAYAADAYQTLTMQPNNQASYIPIKVSSHAEGSAAFRRTAKVLANSYGELLTATATGKFLKKPVQELQNRRPRTPEEEARRIAETTGYAMQMQFLGNRDQARVPRLVRAWITDADLAKLEETQGEVPVRTCEPAVLLSKRQLSKLYEQVKLILDASEEAFLNGDSNLFAQIQSAAAQMSRDPKQFALQPGRNLLENNLLDEVLEDLPYKSDISSMTQQDWENMSTGARQTFISRLKALLERYTMYDADVKNWEGFGATDPDDFVYRVPLSMLP